MNEITIVTAFFDIGRENCGQYARSNKKYLEYFEFWARIQNNLIVYTFKEMGEEVKKIRKKYGLLDKTEIIEIEDETKIEPEIFSKMQEIEKNGNMENYRFFKNLMENKALYDYVMLLKYWCLADASKRKLSTDMMAWIDFGFNHGSDCYINSDEFDFLWKVDLADNKIHLFCLNDIKNEPVYEMVRNTDVYIMGAILLLPRNLCEELWRLVYNANRSLVEVGFIDDDQLLLLMAYRDKKELFELHKSDWFMPLKENGASHLTVKPEEERKKMTFMTKLIENLRNKKRRYIFIKGEKENFNNHVK